jgi:cyclopropane-fatty-acyl-phospholipid synthase
MFVVLQMAAKQAFINELKALPIAVETQAANDQHYQSIPTEFYKLVLGPCMKYSCGYWPSDKTTFEESETAMLQLYCERAELVDGMKASVCMCACVCACVCVVCVCVCVCVLCMCVGG